MSKRLRTQKSVELLLNIVSILVLSIVFIVLWLHYYGNEVFYFSKGNYVIFFIYLILLSVFGHLNGYSSIGSTQTGELIYSEIIALLFTDFVTYLQVSLIAYRLLKTGGFWIILLVQIIVYALLAAIEKKIYYAVLPPIKVLLIYGTEYQDLAEKMQKKHERYFNINQVCHYEGSLEPIKELIPQCEAVMLANLSLNERQQIVDYCYSQYISVFDVPSFYDILMENATYVHLIDTPILLTNHFGPSQAAKLIKRFFDIVLSLIALVISSPIWLIVAICIKSHDGGPVFYKQTRLTQYGREFKIIKFRSMKMDAEKNTGAVLAGENDDRITSVGKVIRRFRLDELPQLLNILSGDMSIVGPRPERPEIVEKILPDCPEFNQRLKVKAGLTGYAQVFGKYNTSLKDKLLLDLIYIESFSIFLDMKIILMTIKILFVKESTEGVETN